MHAQIALGNSFLTFTLLNGNITVKNIDMMQFINSTYLNVTSLIAPVNEGTSSGGSSNAGAIAAGVLVPLIFLAAAAFVGYRYHYGEGFPCLQYTRPYQEQEATERIAFII